MRRIEYTIDDDRAILANRSVGLAHVDELENENVVAGKLRNHAGQLVGGVDLGKVTTVVMPGRTSQ